MNVREMSVGMLISLAGVLEAMRQLNAEEADARKKTVDFVELQFPPDAESAGIAEFVGVKLLKMGVGIKLSVHWPFVGTRSWALQTERTRIVNNGP